MDNKSKSAAWPFDGFSFSLSTRGTQTAREQRNGRVSYGMPMAEILFSVRDIPGAIHRATLWQNWAGDKGNAADKVPPINVLGYSARPEGGGDYTLSFSLPFYPPRDVKQSDEGQTCQAVLDAYKHTVIDSYEVWRDTLAAKPAVLAAAAQTQGRLVRTAKPVSAVQPKPAIAPSA